MFTINKDKFFTILNDLNKPCVYNDIVDKHYNDVPKIKALLEYVDKDKYTIEYVQNRLITVRTKGMPVNLVENIIICPFDTKGSIPDTECQYIDYEFPSTERKSYLTTGNTGGENESYSIKGYMNPAILNSIITYMLNTNLFPIGTMVVFSLKTEATKFDHDDIIEYLQKHNLNQHNKSIRNIIKLDYTSLNKGYPKKNFYSKITIESDSPGYSNFALKKFEQVNNFNYDEKENHEIYLKPMPKIKDSYKKLMDYFNIPLYIEDRLFIFSDTPINFKYNVLANNAFLVEWNSIDKYINQLYFYLKRG